MKTSQKLLTIFIIAGIALTCAWIAWIPGSGNERVIRVAVIPVEDQVDMLEKMKPMFSHIGSICGRSKGGHW